MVILWIVAFILLFVGVRDITRYLWFRAEESVFDGDISRAYLSGNQALALVRIEDRRRWLMRHPVPRITWLGMPLVGIAFATAIATLIMLATMLYIWDTYFDPLSSHIGPYRQVR